MDFDFDEQQTRQTSVVQWIQPALTPVGFKNYRTFNRTRVEMPRIAFIQGQGSATVASWTSSRRSFDVETASGGTLQIRSFWFPGWSATLDGAALAIETAANGTIRFDAPTGNHRVDLVFGSTPIRRAATWTAWSALVLLVLLAVWTSSTLQTWRNQRLRVRDP